jgi:hypothetical protein
MEETAVLDGRTERRFEVLFSFLHASCPRAFAFWRFSFGFSFH